MTIRNYIKLLKLKVLDHQLFFVMLFFSFGISAFSLVMQLLAAKFLSVDVFVEVAMLMYKVGLVGAFCGLANDFYIMRTNSRDRRENTVVNLYSFIYYVVGFSFFAWFFNDYKYQGSLLCITFMATILGVYSSRLRLLEDAYVSSFCERYSPILLAIGFLLIILQEKVGGNQVSGVVSVVVVSVLLFCSFVMSVSRKMTLKLTLKADLVYLKHQFLVYVSILFFVLVLFLDKLVVEKFFKKDDVAYYFVLFQVFSIYKIFGQSVYKYLFVRNHSGAFSVLESKSLFLLVVLSGGGAIPVYCFYEWFYEDKYNIQLLDIFLMSLASMLFVIYQVVSSKINSMLGVDAIIRVNYANICSLVVVLPIFIVGVVENSVTMVVLSFLFFWLVKLFLGAHIVKKACG